MELKNKDIMEIYNCFSDKNKIPDCIISAVDTIKKQKIFEEKMSEYEKAHAKKNEKIRIGKTVIDVEEMQNDYLDMCEKRQKETNEIIQNFNPEAFVKVFMYAKNHHIDNEKSSYQAKYGGDYPKNTDELIQQLDKIISTAEDKNLIEGFDEDLELHNILNNSDDDEIHFTTKNFLFDLNGCIFTLNYTHGQGCLICLDKFPIDNELCKIYIDRYVKNLKDLIYELRKIIDEK